MGHCRALHRAGLYLLAPKAGSDEDSDQLFGWVTMEAGCAGTRLAQQAQSVSIETRQNNDFCLKSIEVW